MPFRKTPLRAGSFYHIYNRGVARQPIFFERDNYAFFLKQLRKFVIDESQDAEVIAYCLMPNHYHILARAKTDALSKAMQSFGQSYSNAINKRRNRVGPLFADRFQSKLVDDDSYLLHLSRYVHLNPVAAGLVALPEDWEFSSYRDFVGVRAGTLPKSDIVLTTIGSVEKYRQFVVDGIGKIDQKIQNLLFDET